MLYHRYFHFERFQSFEIGVLKNCTVVWGRVFIILYFSHFILIISCNARICEVSDRCGVLRCRVVKRQSLIAVASDSGVCNHWRRACLLLPLLLILVLLILPLSLRLRYLTPPLSVWLAAWFIGIYLFIHLLISQPGNLLINGLIDCLGL